MAMVFFTGITPKGDFNEYSYGGPTLNACINVLNGLVNTGWRLIRIRFVEHPAIHKTELPVEAFDGQSMQAHLRQLERSWTTILDNHEAYTQFFARSRAMNASLEEAIKRQQQIAQRRLEAAQRLAALYDRIDSIQTRIEQIKAEWNIV